MTVTVVLNSFDIVNETVYNFEVEGTHNYFADELGLLVHNGKLLDSARHGLFSFLIAFNGVLGADGDITTPDSEGPPKQPPPSACSVQPKDNKRWRSKKAFGKWFDIYD